MNKQNLLYLIKSYEKPARKAFSIRYPFLKPIIIFARRIHRKITNMLNHKISRKKGAFFKCIIARHQSVLTRKLGDSNPNLQTRKIINLKRACENLDGLIIKPGETFSLWETIGKPKKSRGYVDGMLLSNGKITEGIGGGLCQLSNFLCWIFLHTNTKIIERYHHSMDTFPD